jgi:3-phenylpropionate/trans-cinnamate dioxygenase ferredoxin subunit
VSHPGSAGGERGGRGAATRVVLAPGDVPGEGEHRVVEVGPSLRVLLARIGGRLHALDDVCNHGGCHLSAGRVDGVRVTCPCHSMAFDLRDGRLLTRPRLAEDQRTFPVLEEGGQLVVLVPPQA